MRLDQSGIIYTLGWYLEYWKDIGIRVGSLILLWFQAFSTEMGLGSGWDFNLYHTGLTPGVLEWDWDQGLSNHLYYVDNWSTWIKLGLESDHLYDTELTPGVREWSWDHGGITYVTLGWQLTPGVLERDSGVRVRSFLSHWVDTCSTGMKLGSGLGSLISHWVDNWSTGMRLWTGWDHLHHIGLTPGVLKWDYDQSGITYITLGWHLE